MQNNLSKKLSAWDEAARLKSEQAWNVPVVVSSIGGGHRTVEQETEVVRRLEAFKQRYGVVEDTKGERCPFRLLPGRKCTTNVPGLGTYG